MKIHDLVEEVSGPPLNQLMTRMLNSTPTAAAAKNRLFDTERFKEINEIRSE